MHVKIYHQLMICQHVSRIIERKLMSTCVTNPTAAVMSTYIKNLLYMFQPCYAIFAQCFEP